MSRLPIILCCLSVAGMTGSADPAIGRCEQVASIYSQLNAKVSRCTAGETSVPVDLAVCRASIAACSGAEQVAIDQFLGCVAQLPSCEAGELNRWRSQYDACAAGVRLSPNCSL